jgi:hypothetical protein
MICSVDEQVFGVQDPQAPRHRAVARDAGASAKIGVLGGGVDGPGGGSDRVGLIVSWR